MILRTLYTESEVEAVVRRMADEIGFDLTSITPVQAAGPSAAPAAGKGRGRARGRSAPRAASTAAAAAPPGLPTGVGVHPGSRVEIASTLSLERAVLIGMLKGTFIFLADLARAMKLPVDIDFMRVRMRTSERIPDGVVEFDYEPEHSLAGRAVVVVEDVAGSGKTLRAVLARLQAHEPRLLKVCALVRRRGYSGPPVDYVGFDVGPGWLVGYGLDDREAYRNLPGLCILED
jgi:hypoxanthine phosphoribosyltransferase